MVYFTFGLRQLIIYIIAFLFALNASAQYTDAFLYKIPIEDVLPTDRVNAICQDSSGMMWFGTDNGLLSFDGYTLKAYTNDPENNESISSNKVSALLTDSKGRIWIGTKDNGVSIYTPATGQWKHIAFTPNNINGLPAAKTYGIFEVDETYIAIGTHAPDILLVNKQSFETKRIRITETLPYDDRTRHTRSIVVDNRDSNIWWIVGRGGLVKYNKATNTAEALPYNKQAQKERSVYNAMNCVYQDDSTLWVGTWGGGILSFNKEREEFNSYLYNTELKGSGSTNCVFTISIKNDSLFWIGTSDKGLGLFNKNNKRYHFYEHDPTDKHSAPSGTVAMLYKDKNDNTWVASTSGIYLINNSRQIYNTYTLPPGPDITGQHLHYPIFAQPTADKNEIIVGTHNGNGLNIVNKHDKTVKTYHSKFSSENKGYRPVKCFHYANDEYLVVTIKGISFFNVNTKTWRYINDADNNAITKGGIRSCYLSGDSVLLIGTYTGIIRRYNLKTHRLNEWDKNDETKKYKVFDRSIFIDINIDKRGYIVATSFYGLVAIDPVSNKVHSYSINDGDRYKHYRGLGGLHKDERGYLWVESSGGGLICIDHQNEYTPLSSITTKEGVVSNDITNCCIDNKGRFWIGTEQALQCFDNNKQLLLTLRNEQGLPPYYNSWCSTVIHGDEIYILWKHSITTTKTKNLLKQPQVKPLQIESVYCKQLQLDTYKPIKLRHSDNFINIQFSEYDYQYYKDITFRYRFSNDMDWIDNGSQNSINLIGLAPGHYQLEVEQSTKTYNWTQTNKLLNFTIQPPFYKTWWFMFSIIIFAAAIIFSFYRYRYRNLKRVESLKTEFNKKVANLEMEALRSQMNPHFIFNSLNSINYYIVKRRPEDASAYLNKFAKLIRSILTLSKNDTVSLKEELNIIELYCELEQMRFQKHFGYNISVDKDIEPGIIQVPPLLLQPYVENAVWHGIMQKEEGGDIDINVSNIDNGYKFSIKDNGIGRKKSAELRSRSSLKRKSLGAQITSDRIDVFNKLHDDIKLTVEIKDLEDKDKVARGTEVVIKLMNITNE